MKKQSPDYSSLFNFAPLPCWIYDIQTFEILDVNQAAILLYGYSKEEFLSITLKGLRPEEEVPKLVEAHKNVDSRTGNIYFGVFTHKKKSGELVRMEINGHKVEFLGKDCMMVICQDVTKNEKQLKKLKESEERLKAASSIANLGYWRFEFESDALAWTDEVYKIWGRKKEEFDLDFEYFLQSIHPDDLGKFKKEQAALYNGERDLDVIHRIILSNGSVKWVHELGRLIKDENGIINAIEGTVQDITERKETEQHLNKISEKLNESEKWFRIAQEISPDGFTILHPLRNKKGEAVDFTWVFENQAIAKINGTDPNTIIGKRLLDLFPSHRGTKIFDSYVHVANTSESLIIEEVYVGEILSKPTWLRLVIVPLGDDIAVLNQNITDRKLAEEAVRESEAKFRAIFEIASLGIAQVNPSNGKIILVNRYYETITGYTTEELLKISFVELTHPDDRKQDWEIFNKAMRGEMEYRNVKRYVKKDGTIVWVRVHVAFIRDEQGKPIRTVAICEDITLQKDEEQRLKLLESVITNTNDAILITEAEPFEEPGPRILYVNEAFSKMTGYSAKEVIGNTPRILQGPNSDKAELARLGKALRNWEACDITTINYKKSGEEFWINISVSPVANEKGWFTHWIAIERDVTEQKNKEREKELLGQISLDFSIDNDLDTSAHSLCKTISKFGKFDFVELWLPNLDNSLIQLFGHHAQTPNAAIFYEESKDVISFAKSVGLPGKVWQKRSSLLWKDIDKKDDFNRKEAAQKASINLAMGIPLICNDNIVGVLVIGTQKDRNYLKRYIKVFEQFEQFIGSEINRKRLEQDLYHLYNAIPDIICITDMKGKFLKINKAGCELIGYNEDEIINNTFDKFLHPDDRDLSKNDLFKLNNGQNTFGFENRYITKNGEIIWLSWTSNFSQKDGLIYASARNITEEKKLRELNRQANTLAKIGSWEMDLTSNKLYWSDLMHEIHGTDPKSYTPDLEAGVKFYREDFRELVQEAIQNCIDNGAPIDFEAIVITTSGNERWIKAIGNAEFIDGKCQRFFGSFQDIHASKSLEIQIREILGSISDAFYAMDKDWNFTYFNKEAENLLLQKAEDVLGKNIWELFPSAKDTLLQEMYQRVAISENPESIEYLFPGDGKWYEVNAYPSQGGVSVYFKNIDERKQAAEQLEKAYQEKNSILERIGDAFFALDKNWNVTYWNKRAEEIIGIPREDLIGYNLWEKFPLAKDLEFFKQYERAFKTQTPVNFEEFFQPFNQWYEANGYPSPEGISVFFRDITQKKFAEKIVLEANERFEKVTEATNDAIWDYDLVNNHLFWGKGFYTLFGYNPEVIKPSFELLVSLIHEDDRDRIVNQVMHYMADPNLKDWYEEYRFRKADNTFAYVIDRATFIRNSEGSVIRVIGAMNDISERKNFEQQLIALNESLKQYAQDLEITNEQLEQFAYVASHDLQEPLRMITSFLDQLKRKYGDRLDDKAHQYIYFASDGAKRMKQIILDLLEYSRAGRLEEPIEKINVNQILSEYQLLRSKVISEKDVKFNVEDIPLMQGYKAPLIQTLHCLMDNAIKYSKQGVAPQVNVASVDMGDYWMLSVADNGIGIEPEYFEKIFIIFQRLHSRENYEGTGIGLSIAKKHVESWGGKIWVESTPGEGSVFQFTIPKAIKKK